MDCIHSRLLLRGLNYGSNIISKGVGIRIGLIRCVYPPLSPLFSLCHSSCHTCFSSTYFFPKHYLAPSLSLFALLDRTDVQPEWAFANILDQIYEHQSFIKEYLQPLTTKAGYDINVKVNPLPSSISLLQRNRRKAKTAVRVYPPPLPNPTSIPQIPDSSFTRPPSITSAYDISNYLI